MTAAELRAFESEIATLFNEGRIRAPVHLESGNEDALIEIFKDVKPQDWVCGSWRMHLKCLLKNVPPAELKAEILAGRSIALCFPKYRVISSAIVGGIIPIAVGLAMAAKRRGSDETIWVFLGDMTAHTGAALECANYAEAWELPMRFVIEDNGLSVCSPTRDVWNGREPSLPGAQSFEYHSHFPHAGAGKRVQF